MSGKNAYHDEELKKLQEQYHASGREKRAVRRSAPELLALQGMILYFRGKIFKNICADHGVIYCEFSEACIVKKFYRIFLPRFLINSNFYNALNTNLL